MIRIKEVKLTHCIYCVVFVKRMTDVQPGKMFGSTISLVQMHTKKAKSPGPDRKRLAKALSLSGKQTIKNRCTNEELAQNRGNAQVHHTILKGLKWHGSQHYKRSVFLVVASNEISKVVSAFEAEVHVRRADETFPAHGFSEPAKNQVEPQPISWSIEIAFTTKVLLKRTETFDEIIVLTINEKWKNYELEQDGGDWPENLILTDPPFGPQSSSISIKQSCAFSREMTLQTYAQCIEWMLVAEVIHRSF